MLYYDELVELWWGEWPHEEGDGVVVVRMTDVVYQRHLHAAASEEDKARLRTDLAYWRGCGDELVTVRHVPKPMHG